MANIIMQDDDACLCDDCGKEQGKHTIFWGQYSVIDLCDNCLKELAITINDYLEFLKE